MALTLKAPQEMWVPRKYHIVFRSGSINFYHREMALFITESHAGLADHGIDTLLRKVSSAFRKVKANSNLMLGY
jgi:hypothetical protein